MNAAQLTKLIDDGAIIVKGSYWSGGVSIISGRGKDGQRREWHVVRETILVESGTLAVSRFMRDDEKPEDWKPSAKRMDKVICRIASMKSENGAVTLSGTVEPLT